jgi:hypothetical protein
MTVTEFVRRFAIRSRSPLCCSACGLPKSSDRRLISGPSLCADCRDLAERIFERDARLS